MSSKKVVFFFPAFSSQEATAPLGILAVATPLLRAGYQVRIIDSTITPNFQKTVLDELRDALCLAVSLVIRAPNSGTNIFTPYPGAPVMERAFELGIQVPKTFEEWSDFFPRYTVLPWMSGKKHERMQTMREYLRMAFQRVPVSIHRKGRFTRARARVAGDPVALAARS